MLLFSVIWISQVGLAIAWEMSDAHLAAVPLHLHYPAFPRHHAALRSCLPLPRLNRKNSLSPPSIGTISLSRAVSFAAAGGTTAWSAKEVAPSPEEEEPPTSVALEPIVSEEHFDRIIAEAHQLEEPIVVLWFGFEPLDSSFFCAFSFYLLGLFIRLILDYTFQNPSFNWGLWACFWWICSLYVLILCQ